MRFIIAKYFLIVSVFVVLSSCDHSEDEYIELNYRIMAFDLSWIWDTREWPPPPATITSVEELHEIVLTPAYNNADPWNPFSTVEDIFRYYDEDFFEDYYIIFFPVVGDRRFIIFSGVTVDGDIVFYHPTFRPGTVFTLDFQVYMLILEISKEFYFD